MTIIEKFNHRVEFILSGWMGPDFKGVEPASSAHYLRINDEKWQRLPNNTGSSDFSYERSLIELLRSAMNEDEMNYIVQSIRDDIKAFKEDAIA